MTQNCYFTLHIIKREKNVPLSFNCYYGNFVWIIQRVKSIKLKLNLFLRLMSAIVFILIASFLLLISPNKVIRDFFFIAGLIQLIYFLVLFALNLKAKRLK